MFFLGFPVKENTIDPFFPTLEILRGKAKSRLKYIRLSWAVNNGVDMKVSKDQVEAAVVGKNFTLMPDGRTMVCTLTLESGFTVRGESWVVDATEFVKELGEKYSYERALDQVWMFLGYDLVKNIHLIKQGTAASRVVATEEPKTYIGTKVVHATPMNRREYNYFRGWDLPANENGADEGYLVEYADGGAGNVPGVTGYVSWSPKAVFEKAYVPFQYQPGQQNNPAPTAPTTSTWDSRLVTEMEELTKKVQQLANFIESPKFKELRGKSQADLREQHTHMSNYLWVLNRRIHELKPS